MLKKGQHAKHAKENKILSGRSPLRHNKTNRNEKSHDQQNLWQTRQQHWQHRREVKIMLTKTNIAYKQTGNETHESSYKNHHLILKGRRLKQTKSTCSPTERTIAKQQMPKQPSDEIDQKLQNTHGQLTNEFEEKQRQSKIGQKQTSRPTNGQLNKTKNETLNQEIAVAVTAPKPPITDRMHKGSTTVTASAHKAVIDQIHDRLWLKHDRKMRLQDKMQTTTSRKQDNNNQHQLCNIVNHATQRQLNEKKTKLETRL